MGSVLGWGGAEGELGHRDRPALGWEGTLRAAQGSFEVSGEGQGRAERRRSAPKAGKGRGGSGRAGL